MSGLDRREPRPHLHRESEEESVKEVSRKVCVDESLPRPTYRNLRWTGGMVVSGARRDKLADGVVRTEVD